MDIQNPQTRHDPTTAARMAQHWEDANTAEARRDHMAILRRRAPLIALSTAAVLALAILALLFATRPVAGDTHAPSQITCDSAHRCQQSPLAPQVSPRPVRNPIYGENR